MDKRAAEICAKAFDILDAVDQQRDEWDAARQAETVFEKMDRENALDDAYVERVRLQRLEQQRSHLVYKQVDNARIPEAQPMTDAADRKWVMQQLEAFASMLGKAVAEIENELVRKLRGEIEQLRGEVAQMKAAKPTVSAEGSVLSLRGRNVA